MIGEEGRIGVHRHRNGPTHIVATHHLETEIVHKVLEHIRALVDALLHKQLLAHAALHVKCLWDLASLHMDGKWHVSPLPGFNGLLLQGHRERQWLFVLLPIVKDALCRLYGKLGKKNG